jgi:hypothetical protein
MSAIAYTLTLYRPISCFEPTHHAVSSKAAMVRRGAGVRRAIDDISARGRAPGRADHARRDGGAGQEDAMSAKRSRRGSSRPRRAELR